MDLVVKFNVKSSQATKCKNAGHAPSIKLLAITVNSRKYFKTTDNKRS